MPTAYGTYTYVSLAEIKDYLSINSTTHDGRLSNIIGFACGAVENYIGREIKNNVYTEVFCLRRKQILIFIHQTKSIAYWTLCD